MGHGFVPQRLNLSQTEAAKRRQMFPSAKDGRGFKPIADRIHEMGLKFGIHIMRGIPRQAVHDRMTRRWPGLNIHEHS